MTQLERVAEYIKEQGSVHTWELEAWAKENTYKPCMLGGSATRYARKLRLEGKVEHPILKGKEDRHCYRWINKQPIFKTDKLGNGLLF